MLLFIFNWLSEGVGKAMDAFSVSFLEALNMDLQNFVNIFPLFGDVYTILQSVALGLLIVLAAVSLYQYFFSFGESQSFQESPVKILFRTILAALLIYIGGSVLNEMINIAKIPYDYFMNMDIGDYRKGPFSALNGEEVLGETILAVSTSAQVIISLVLTITVAWNLLKLVIETAERYLIVAVLVYTSPLIYATLASKRTEQIFKRWVSMFVSSLILMSFSVLFFKAIFSALISTAENSFGELIFRIIMILAMCKVAQRVDTYLQQLGLSAATTGGSLLDDVIATARGIKGASRVASDAVNNRGLVGKMFGRTAPGMAINAARAAATAKQAGASNVEAAKAAGLGALKGRAVTGRAVAAGQAAKAGATKAATMGQTGADKAGTIAAEMAQAMKDPVTYVPGAEPQKQNGQTAVEQREQDVAKAKADVDKRTAAPPMEGKRVPEAVQEKIDSNQNISGAEADRNFNTYGAKENGFAAARIDENGNIVPDYNFAAAGGAIENLSGEGDNQNGSDTATGDMVYTANNQDAVGDVLRNSDSDDTVRGLEKESVPEVSSFVAQAKAEHTPVTSEGDSYEKINNDKANIDSAYSSAQADYASQMATASTDEEKATVQRAMDAATAEYQSQTAAITARTNALDNTCQQEGEKAWSEANRDADRNYSETRSNIRQIAMNTARNNPAASTSAMFSRTVDGTKNYTDDYGQSLMEGAFGSTIGKDYGSIRGVTITGTEHGSELTFKATPKTTGSKQPLSEGTYHVIEKAAYLHRTPSERLKYREITCADGITRYTDAIISNSIEKIFKMNKR